MTASSAILRARAAAERLMIDACTVQRQTGSTTNTETGMVVPVLWTVYTGPCKVQQRSAGGSPRNLGEAAVFVSRSELHLPVAVTAVASDDLVTITASTHDPKLVNRQYHIQELSHKSFLSARRFAMVEVTS
jgi:hypothetical protein